MTPWMKARWTSVVASLIASAQAKPEYTSKHAKGTRKPADYEAKRKLRRKMVKASRKINR